MPIVMYPYSISKLVSILVPLIPYNKKLVVCAFNNPVSEITFVFVTILVSQFFPSG